MDADKVAEIGVRPEGTDRMAMIHGIGGTETVNKWVVFLDSISANHHAAANCGFAERYRLTVMIIDP
ncbi:hypothetical protein [Paenibacillus thalictri]|uniref:hypothetical protein n=1 Tax=Paenibacillus thalictri TaxID=2527873 RepID=UPI0013EF3B65|nr:hypothetical protein [Paenibacillus thalictri]